MPTCERCGDGAAETFTLSLEWPTEDPEDYDDPVEFEDPGAAVLDVCGRCASATADNLLVDRAVTRGFDSVYAGLYAPPEVRP
jgi:hypothetical protein